MVANVHADHFCSSKDLQLGTNDKPKLSFADLLMNVFFCLKDIFENKLLYPFEHLQEI